MAKINIKTRTGEIFYKTYNKYVFFGKIKDRIFVICLIIHCVIRSSSLFHWILPKFYALGNHVNTVARDSLSSIHSHHVFAKLKQFKV
jgi:hypothetical protein